MLAPHYKRLSDEYQGKLKFAKTDTVVHGNTRIRYGIQAIPTMMVFKDGKAVGSILGADPGRLEKQIDGILAENNVR
jgi:thioredoxin 1